MVSETERAVAIVHMLRVATKNMVQPMVTTIVEEFGCDPFLILISCLLSLRARDSATLPLCRLLFKKATTPEQLLKIPLPALEQIILPIGFYKTKARVLHEVSRDLITRFGSNVPSNEADLLSIKGVGRKTAALVLAEAFNIPSICVDIHVHRISNRLGLVHTKTAAETETALKQILPVQYWSEWNKLLVVWGQNICVPISPKCSECAIFKLCDRVGVTKSR